MLTAPTQKYFPVLDLLSPTVGVLYCNTRTQTDDSCLTTFTEKYVVCFTFVHDCAVLWFAIEPSPMMVAKLSSVCVLCARLGENCTIAMFCICIHLSTAICPATVNTELNAAQQLQSCEGITGNQATCERKQNQAIQRPCISLILLLKASSLSDAEGWQHLWKAGYDFRDTSSVKSSLVSQ